MPQNTFANGEKMMRSLLLIFFVLAACPLLVYGQLQDNIYLENETSIGNVKITDVGSKKVKYQNQQGKEYDFKTRDVLMVFNGQGKYLVFPASSRDISYFLAKESKKPDTDLIITMSGNVIAAGISEENMQEVGYHDLESGKKNIKIKASEIAAIIYRNGNHKLFTSPSGAAEKLSSLKDKVNTARLAEYKVPEEEKRPDVFSQDFQANKESKPLAEPVKKKTVKEPFLPASMEIDPELYSRKALQKTTDLGTYLAIISDRNNDIKEANKAVDLAVKLFINEDAQIEVSGLGERQRYKVRAYLNRLKLLKYDKIEISWTDISYVSDLKKGMDGNYYGIITLQQRFKGFMDNQLVYSDLTEKNVEVKVMSYQKETDGEKQEMWDVFLSDIGVVVTKID